MDNVNVTESQNLKKGKGMKKGTKILLIVLSVIFMLTAVIVPVVVFTAPRDPGYIEEETDNYLLRYRPGEDYYDIVLYTGTDENVIIPAEINGVRVRNILEGAFSAEERSSNKNIKSVEFEVIYEDGTGVIIGGIEKIGERAFEGCSSLTTIEIPSTVKTLSAEAFSGSGLEKLVVLDADTLKLETNALKGADKLTTVSITAGKVNKDNLTNYGSGSNIDNVEIGNNVSEVSPDAFNELSSMTTFSVYNIDTLKLETMSDINNNITTVNILPNTSVLTADFMGKIAAYCGKNVNTVNIYPGINVIQEGAFTSTGFAQFKDYGGNIYISDDAVIDIGAINTSYKYTINLHQFGEDDVKSNYTLNVSANRAVNGIVTNEFFARFDSTDLSKVSLLNFSGKRIKLDENNDIGEMLVTENYTDDNNQSVVLDGITTFDQNSLSAFNYIEGGLKYIVFGTEVTTFSDETFGTIQSVPQTFASNVSESDDLLAFVNIYMVVEPKTDYYNETIYKTFNRVINSVNDDGTTNVYKERFLSRKSFNGVEELGSRWITFNYVIDGVVNDEASKTVEAEISTTLNPITLEYVLGSTPEIVGYEINSWYTTEDLSGDAISLSTVLVTHDIADTYYAKCAPVDVNYIIKIDYENVLNEENLVRLIEGTSKFGTTINIEEKLASIIAEEKGCIKDSVGNLVHGFVLDSETPTEYKIVTIETNTINVKFVRPEFKVLFNNDNKGTIEYKEQVVKYGSQITFPKVERTDGYYVDYWKNTQEYISDVEAELETVKTKLVLNVNDFVKYAQSEFELTFESVFIGEIVELVTFEYHLGHWDDTEGGFVSEGEIASKLNLTTYNNGDPFRVGDKINLHYTNKNITGYSPLVKIGHEEFTITKNDENDYNTTIKAYYGKINYTLNFVAGENGNLDLDLDNDGEDETFVRQINYIEPFKVLPTASKIGYQFNGWTVTNKNGVTTPITSDYSSFNAEFINNYADVDNVTLTASYIANTYKITFDNVQEGYNNNEYTTATYDSDVELVEPELVGHIFLGWTLVNYDGEDVNKFAQYHNGTTFENWNGTEVFSNQFKNLTYVQNGEVQLHANWKYIKYNVTIDLNGGKIGNVTSYEKQEKVYGTSFTIDASTVPTKAGHYFTGWSVTGAAGDYSVTYNTNGIATFLNLHNTDGANVTITAQYELNKYIVKYNNNSNSVEFSYNKNQEEDFKFEHTLPLNDGEEFDYWTFDGIKEGAKISNTALYSVTDFINTFGVNTESNSVEYTVTNDGKTLTVEPTAHVIVLNPVYKSSAYTITLDGNGASLGQNTYSDTFNSENGVTIPKPMRTGYIFEGWTVKTGTLYTSATVNESAWEDGTTAVGKDVDNVVFKNLTTSGSIALLANWTPTTYTVVSDSDNAEITIKDGNNVVTELIFGKEYTISVETKTGYKLTSVASTDDLYINASINNTTNWTGTNYTLTSYEFKITNLSHVGSEIELVFSWTPITYNIDIVRYNTTENIKNVSFGAEYVLNLPSNRNGWTFAGYSISGYHEDTALIYNQNEDNFDSYDGNLIIVNTKLMNLHHVENTTVTITENWTANTNNSVTVNYYVSKLVNGTTNLDYGKIASYTKVANASKTSVKTGTIYTLADLIDSDILNSLNADFGNLELQNTESFGGETFVIAPTTGTETTINVYYKRQVVEVTFKGSNDLIYYFSYVSKGTTYNPDENNNLPLEIFDETGSEITGWEVEGHTGTTYNKVNDIVINQYVQDGKITLVPVWDEKTYTVKYELDGGDFTAHTTTNPKVDIEFTVPNPVKAGYTFKGWTLSATNESVLADAQYLNGTSWTNWDSDKWSTPINATTFKDLSNVKDNEVTLTANWDENVYTIKFGSNSMQLEYGAPTTIPFTTWVKNTTPKGQTFAKLWFELGETDKEITTTLKDYTINELLLACYDNVNVEDYNSNNELTFYATYDYITYTINFETGTADVVNSIEFKVNENVTITSGEGLTKVGYTFSKWVITGSSTEIVIKEYKVDNGGVNEVIELYNTLQLTQTITSVNLQAVWTENTYTITFEPNDGEFNGAPTVTLVEGTFDSTNIKLDNNVYTIENVPYTATIKIADPKYTGFTFGGWGVGTHNNDNKETTFTKLATGETGDDSVTLTAVWTERGYTISISQGSYVTRTATEFNNYDFVDGFNATLIPNTLSYSFTSEFNIVAQKAGYTFKGWKATGLNSNTAEYYNGSEWIDWNGNDVVNPIKFRQLTDVVDTNVEFTPYFVENQYVIVKNGVESQVYFTDTVSLTGYTEPTGYTFKGWSVVGFDTDTALFGGNASTVNGVFTPVTFDSVTYNVTNVQSVKQLSIGVETINESNKDSVTITIDAVNQNNGYTITLDGNGTSLDKTTIDGTFDKNVEAIAKPSRTGYTFQGWTVTAGTLYTGATVNGSTWSNGATAVGKDAESVVLKNLVTGETGNTEITLQAQWTPNNYNVDVYTKVANNNSVYNKTLNATFDNENSLIITAPIIGGYTVKFISADNLANDTPAYWNGSTYVTGWTGEKVSTGTVIKVKNLQTENVDVLDVENENSVKLYLYYEADEYVVTTQSSESATVKFADGTTSFDTETDSFVIVYITPNTGYKLSNEIATVVSFVTGNANVELYTDGVPAGTLAVKVSGYTETFTISATLPEIEYTLKFDLSENGKFEDSVETSYSYNEEIELPTPVRDGYTFKGWEATGINNSLAQVKYNGESLFEDWDGTEVEDAVMFKNLVAIDGEEVTFKATWYKHSYVVVFDLDGGAFKAAPTYNGIQFTIVDGKYTATVPYDAVINIAEVEKPGYEFTGIVLSDGIKSDYAMASADTNWVFETDNWNGSATNNTYFKQLSHGSKVAQYPVITLKATWGENTYTVNYNVFGGNEKPDVDAVIAPTYDVEFEVKSPSKDGYTFAGWVLSTTLESSTLNNAQYKSGSTFVNWNGTTPIGKGSETVTFINLSNKKGGAVKLTAQWELNVYKIEIKDKGVSSDELKLAYYIDNTISEDLIINKVALEEAGYLNIVTISAPIADTGYYFNGWSTSDTLCSEAEAGGSSWDGELTRVTTFKNLSYGSEYNGSSETIVTIESDYQLNTYKIELDGNGVDLTETSYNATFGSNVNIPNPDAREGYTFIGWSVKSGTLYTDTTYGARYGSSNDSVNTVWTSGVSNRTATYFKNLLLGSEAGTETITLKAEWSENSYQIKFTLGDTLYGGTLEESDLAYTYTYVNVAGQTINGSGNLTKDGNYYVTGNLPYSSTITLNNPAFNGYEFAGWDGIVDADTENGTTTFTLKPNGTTETTTLVVEIALNNPTPSSYNVTVNFDNTLIGTTSSNLKAESLTPNTKTGDTLEIYVKASDNYHINIESYLSIDDNSVVFAIEKVDNDNNIYKVTFSNYRKAFNATLFAQINTYNVTVYEQVIDGIANKNEISKTQIETKSDVEYNSTFELELTEKDGYTFQGWMVVGFTTDATINTTVITSATDLYLKTALSDTATSFSFKNLNDEDGANVTIYAVYTRNTYTIKIDLNDNDSSYEASITSGTSYNATFDGTATEVVKPTRVGYTFNGWIVSVGTLHNSATANAISWTDENSVVGVNDNSVAFKNLLAGNESGAESITLQAQWIAKDATYTVKVYLSNEDVNGELTVGYPTTPAYTNTYNSTTDAVLDIDDIKNDIITDILSEHVSGLDFDSYVMNDSTVNAKEDTTLTVVELYYTRKTVEVTYMSNEGDLDDVVKTYTYDLDNKKTLSTSIFTLDGWTFSRWVDEYGEPLESTKTNAFIADGSVTVVAEWTDDSYSIILDELYNANDNKLEQTNISAVIGETEEVAKITVLDEEPERNGYTFNGWKLTAENNTYLTNAKYKKDGVWYNWSVDDEPINSLTFMNLSNTVGKSVTLTADWTPNVYTVKAGTGYLETREYDNSNVINIPEFNSTGLVASTGYHFSHWIVNGETISGSYTMKELLVAIKAVKPYKTTTIELTPEYVANTYTITLDGNGANLSGTSYEGTFDKDVAAIAKPSRTGYTFQGWTVKTGTLYTGATVNGSTWSNGATAVGKDAESVVFKNLVTGETGNTEITLQAQWTENKYIVEFKLNDAIYGGTFDVDGSGVVEDDEKPFWDHTGNTFTMIGTNIATSIVSYNSTIQINDTIFIGYTFNGWDTAGTRVSNGWKFKNLSTGVETITDENKESVTVTITANIPTVHTYSVKVYNNVDSSVATYEGLEYNTDVDTLNNSYTNYTFVGWKHVSGLTQTAEYYNGTNWVKWYNEGTSSYPDIDAQNFVKFRNLTSEDGRIVELTAMFVGNIYEVTFDYDNGDSSSDNVIVVNFGSNVLEHSSYVEPTKTGYTFQGWIPTTIGDTAEYYNGTEWKDWTDGVVKNSAIRNLIATNISENGTITNDEKVTLTAAWTENVYTLTFDAIGGMLNEAPTVTLTEGTFDTNNIKFANNVYTIENVPYTATITIAEPTRNGYTFDGWYNGSDEVTTFTKLATGEAGDNTVTLTADWTEHVYTLIIDVANGTTTPTVTGATAELVNGKYEIKNLPFSALVTLSEPTRDGYKFNGITKISGTLYNNALAGDTVWTGTQTNALTFKQLSVGVLPTEGTQPIIEIKLNWTNKQYTINLDKNEGTLTGSNTFTDTFDSTTGVVITAPERTGYTFAGWVVSSGTLYAGATANGNTWTNGNIAVGGDLQPVVFKNLSVGSEKAADTVITLQAQWTENKYSVTFDANGGTVSKPSVDKDGTETITPDDATSGSYTISNVLYTATITIAEPTRTGYTFAGWYNGSDEVTTFTELATGEAGDNTVTLTAKWDANEYTISIDLNDADNEFKATIEGGKSYPAKFDKGVEIKKPERIGHTFLGWVVSSGTLYTGATATGITGNWNGTEAVGKNVDKVTFTKLVTGVDGNNTITLQATWTVNNYNISIDLNDDDSDVKAELTTTINNPYAFTAKEIEIANPERIGYTFAGWKVNGYNKDTAIFGASKTDVSENFVTKVTKFSHLTDSNNGTVTFVAQWTENEYTLIIDKNLDLDNNHTTDTTNVETLVKNYTDVFTIDEPTKTGYTFDGWYNGNVKVTTFTKLATGEADDNTVTITAAWTENKYTLVIDKNFDLDNNHTTDTTNVETLVKNYTDVFTIDEPTKYGYEFDGWYNGNVKVTTFTKLATGEAGDNTVTLTAKWTAKTFDLVINFVYNGVESGNVKVDGSVVNNHKYTKAYDFGSNGNYNVEVEINGVNYFLSLGSKSTGVYSNLDDMNKYTGSYNFNTESNIEYTIYLNEVHTVTFDANGGTGTVPSDIYVLHETELDLTIYSATLERTGYTLKGWTTTQTNETPESAVTITDNKNIYACWKENSYIVNGKEYKFTTEFTVEEPTRTGYTFNGWTITNLTSGVAKVNGVVINSTEVTTGKGSVTLQYLNVGTSEETYPEVGMVAEWTENVYTLTFDVNDGTYNGAPTVDKEDPDNRVEITGTYTLANVLYTATITIAEPTRTGYTFAGWYNGSDEVTTFTQLATGEAGDNTVTLTAKWTENVYELKFDLNNGTLDIDNSKTVEEDELPFYTHIVNGKVYFTDNGDGTYTANNVPYTAIITINDPIRTGFTFNNWGAGAHNTTNKVTTFEKLATGEADDNPVTLTAAWTENVYTLTFDAIGGMLNEAPTVTLTEGTFDTNNIKFANNIYTIENIPYTATIKIQEATKNGYTLKGYKYPTIDTSSKITADYRYSSEQAWTMNSWNGSIIEINGNNTTIEYIEFKELKESNDANVTIEADWTEHSYKLIVDLNDDDSDIKATLDTTIKTSYQFSAEFTIADPTRTGYTFAGWTITNLTSGIAKVNGEVIDSAKVTTENEKETEEVKLQYLNVGTSKEPYPEVVMTANWTENEYKLAFDLNEGTFDVDDSGVVEDDEKPYYTHNGNTVYFTLVNGKYEATVPYTAVVTVNDPIKTGHGFNGWHNGDTKVELFTKLSTGDAVELIAIYGAEEFDLTVNFAYNAIDSHTGTITVNGTSSYVVSGIYGTSVSVEIVVTGDYKYVLSLGSSLKDSYNVEPSENVNSYTYSWSVGANDEEITIYLNEVHTVTFDANGGTGDLPENNPIYVTHGAVLNLNYSSSLDRIGYTYQGWATSSTATSVESTATINDNTIIYAVWTENRYNVIFDANGGTVSKPSVDKDGTETITPDDATSGSYTISNVLYTATITIAEPTRTGYTFAGWYNGSDEVTTFTKLEADKEETVTLTAEWLENKYTVYISLNDITYGGTMTAPTYTYKNEQGEDVTVNFTLANGKYEAIVPYTAVIKISEPTGVGYTFKEWTTNVETLEKLVTDGKETTATGLLNGSQSGADVSVTIEAAWTENKYNVTFDLNDSPVFAGTEKGAKFNGAPTAEGATIELVGLQYKVSNIKYSTQISILAPSRIGNTFKGWKVSGYNQETAKFDTFLCLVDTDAESNEIYYLDMNKNSVYDEGVDTVVSNNVFNVTTFLSLSLGTSVTPYPELTISAEWDENEYTIIFDANGGEFKGQPTADGATVELVDGKYKLINIPYYSFVNIVDPEKTGYTFDGWLDGEDTIRPAFYGIRTENGDVVTLVAQWTENKYTVTFAADGATMTAPTVTLTEGTFDSSNIKFNNNVYTIENVPYTAIINIANPTKNEYNDAYNFTGWTVSIDSTDKFTGKTSFKVSDFVANGASDNSDISVYVETYTHENAEDSSVGFVPKKILLNIKYNYRYATDKNVQLFVETSVGTNEVEIEDNYRELVCYYGGSFTFSLTHNGSSHELVMYNKNKESIQFNLDKSVKYTFADLYANLWKPGAFDPSENVLYYDVNCTIYELYDIKYYDNDNNELESKTIRHGSPYELDSYANDLSKCGYSPNGWQYTNNALVGERAPSAIETVTSDINVYANWTENQYNVTFDANGGEFTSVPTHNGTQFTLTDGKYTAKVLYTSIITPPTVQRAGYTFLGWYDGETKVESFTQLRCNKDDVVYLTAHWEVNKVDVHIAYGSRYNGNLTEIKLYEGGNITVSQKNTSISPVSNNHSTKPLNIVYRVEIGSSSVNSDVTITAVPASGYTFKGWYYFTYTDEGNIYVGNEYLVDGVHHKDTTLVQKFNVDTNIFALFEANVYDINVSVRVRYPQDARTGAFAHASTLTLYDGSSVPLNNWISNGYNVVTGFTIPNTDKYWANPTTTDNTTWTIPVSRTGNLSQVLPTLVPGYSYVGYSKTDYTGQNTVGTDNGITAAYYSNDNVTANDTVYYYIQANNYDLDVDYGLDVTFKDSLNHIFNFGKGVWVENGVAQTSSAKSIIGLITNVKYGFDVIVGDAYLIGCAASKLNINNTEFDKDTGIHQKTLANLEKVTGNITWELVPIYVIAKDANGKLIAEGADMESWKFSRYITNINDLAKYFNSALIAEMEVIFVSTNANMLVSSNYELTAAFNISKNVTFSEIEKYVTSTDDGHNEDCIKHIISANNLITINSGSLTIESGIEIQVPANFTGTFIQVNEGATLNFSADMVGLATSKTNQTNAIINGAAGSTINVNGASFTNVAGKNVISTKGNIELIDSTFTNNYTDTDVVIGTIPTV